MSQLLFEQIEEEFFDVNELDISFSKEWDESKIMSVPIVYPDKMRELREIANDPDTSSLLIDTADIRAGERLTEEEYSQLVPTGVVQDLIQVTNDAKEDREQVKKAKRNLVNVEDTALRDRIEDSIEDYYSNRIFYHTENICQHIDALIEFDGYPTRMFGAYKKARRRIATETDSMEADRILNILILLGRSAVPPDKRYIEPETVEPSITSSLKTIG